MNRMLVLGGLLAMITVGCSGRPEFQASLNAWVGQDATHLLDAWGPATRTIQTPEGHMVYVWDRTIAPEGPGILPIDNPGVLVPKPVKECMRIAEADAAGKIVKMDYQGDACF